LANRVGQGPLGPIPPSEPRYNAHQNQFITRVYYPFHPRTGEEIYVVGTRNHRGETCFVTKKPDGRHELIPAWMTNPKYEKISLGSKPAIEIRALKNLYCLIVNRKIPFPPDEVNSKTRRKDDETKISSTSALGLFTITDRNSNRNTK